MKTYLPILLIVFMLQKPSFGQGIPIDSFYRDGAKWTNSIFSYQYNCLNCWEEELKGFNIQIQGDSLIQEGPNLVQYKLLYYTYIGGYKYVRWTGGIEFNFFHADSFSHYLGRIRLSGRKVFFTLEIQPSWPLCRIMGQETLLFDFGLNTSDTFSFPCLYKSTVNSIDSVQLPSGIYIKKYNAGATFFEGIGGQDEGLLDLFSILFYGPSSPYGGTQDFLCYENRELSFYTQDHNLKHGLGDSCFNIERAIKAYNDSVNDRNNNSNNNNSINNNKTHSDSTISIYPNPLQGDILQIQGIDNSLIEKVELYDMIWNVCQVYEHPFKRWNDNELQIPFKTGVYFVKIVFADNFYVVKRLVKL